MTVPAPLDPGRRNLPRGQCGRGASRGPGRPGGAANLRSTAPLASWSPPLRAPLRAGFTGCPAARQPPGSVPAACRRHLAPIAEIRASGSVQHVF